VGYHDRFSAGLFDISSEINIIKVYCRSTVIIQMSTVAMISHERGTGAAAAVIYIEIERKD